VTPAEALRDPSVRGPHPDGSYTSVCPSEFGGDWTIRDTGEGWEATHPRDGFDCPLFLTAGDALAAVLGDPGRCRLFDGGTVSDWDRWLR
jgi:hypothetical protein